MHSLRPLSIVLSLSAFVAVACHAPARAQPELAGCHPACPGAVEAAIGDAGAGLRGAPAQPPPALEASPPAPSALAYLCPMHHHIGSDQPGRCPECGMELVPRAQALEHDHAK